MHFSTDLQIRYCAVESANSYIRAPAGAMGGQYNPLRRIYVCHLSAHHCVNRNWVTTATISKSIASISTQLGRARDVVRSSTKQSFGGGEPLELPATPISRRRLGSVRSCPLNKLEERDGNSALWWNSRRADDRTRSWTETLKMRTYAGRKVR